MKKRKFLSLIAACACALSLLTGCGSKGTKTGGSDTANSDHPVITMNAPYSKTTELYNLVHEKYPEVNLEIEPYAGQNTTSYFTDMRKSGNLPDIYFSTIYAPGKYDDASDLLDLSGYDFTGRFAQSRLREVTNNGGIYMLPLTYNALGITYNKTILDENNWTLPTNLKEMEELKTKAEDAGYIFCRDQLQFPGYGFQYLCNILDTGFLSTVDGIAWQNDFINGNATVSDTPEMKESLKLLERWRDLGLLNSDGTPEDDTATKLQMVEGKTLFLVGNSNDLNAVEGANGQFRLMPYLSEDGNQNVYILNVSRYVGLNKKLGEKGNEKKLEDVLKIMDVLSTEEGMAALNPTQNNSLLFPLKDATVSEDSYYADILDELNSGHTAGFIYSGWENIVVPLGEKMIEYVSGDATIDDVEKCFDENQKLITEDTIENYTTATEIIGMEDCAKAVGISFAQATDSEAALISTNPWIYENDAEITNSEGVSGRLFALPIGDQQLVAILPTGWSGTIQTVTLTGARIKELAESGYVKDDGGVVPYVLVTKGGEDLEDDKTYTIPICGASEKVLEEGNVTDSGVVGLDAAKEYFSQFDTISAKDIVWE